MHDQLWATPSTSSKTPAAAIADKAEKASEKRNQKKDKDKGQGQKDKHGKSVKEN